MSECDATAVETREEASYIPNVCTYDSMQEAYWGLVVMHSYRLRPLVAMCWIFSFLVTHGELVLGHYKQVAVEPPRAGGASMQLPPRCTRLMSVGIMHAIFSAFYLTTRVLGYFLPRRLHRDRARRTLRYIRFESAAVG